MCVNRRLPCCRGVVARLSSCNGDVKMLDRVGSQVCFFSTLCWYHCCVSVSTAQCRAHTHLYITLQRTCALICPTTAIFIHSSRPACAIQKVACYTSSIVVAPALTDLETRRFGIFIISQHFSRSVLRRLSNLLDGVRELMAYEVHVGDDGMVAVVEDTPTAQRMESQSAV